MNTANAPDWRRVVRQVDGAISAARDTAWRAILARACREGDVEQYADAELVEVSDHAITLRLTAEQGARGLDAGAQLRRLVDALHRAFGRPVAVGIVLRESGG